MDLNLWLYRLKKLWQYYLNAHSMHRVDSPFLYQLLRPALDDNRWYYAFEELEVLRKKMKKSDHPIDRTDWGKGGVSYPSTIGKTARQSLSKAADCRIFFRLIQEFKPNKILELGTSLGLTSLYFSRAAGQAEIHTIEGDPVLYKLAAKHFEWMDADNVHQHLGRFQDQLPKLLNEQDPFDCTFTDGHHHYRPTVDNVQLLMKHSQPKSLHIVHDIYHNPEMEKAWKELRSDEQVDASVDMFRFGLLIKNPALIDPVHLTIIPYQWKPWSIGLFR